MRTRKRNILLGGIIVVLLSVGFTTLRNKDLELVAINDLTSPKTLAHLLKYDSVHRVFPGTVEAKENSIVVNGKEIPIYAIRNPAELPWKELGIELD